MAFVSLDFPRRGFDTKCSYIASIECTRITLYVFMHVPHAYGRSHCSYIFILIKIIGGSEKYEIQICITFVWKIRFGQIQHFLFIVIIFCAVPDTRTWLIGGLLSLLILTFIILIIYKIFKIDLVLWYRDSGCAFVSKEGKWVWLIML